ncbi:MAG: (Fe-S)-binding protein [Desulfobaccales bacterium]|nr:(Fe-S)-binding protein [Desulfobaccales bacterium]
MKSPQLSDPLALADQGPAAPGQPKSSPLQGAGRGFGGGRGSNKKAPPALPQGTPPHPSACVRCGACMAVCPLYRLIGREMAVARGKLNLLAVYQERGPASEKLLREVLECCLLCGACQATCAVGLPVPELIKEARAFLSARQGLKWSPSLWLARLTWQAPQLIPALAPLAPVLNLLKTWVGEESGLALRLWPHLAANLRRLPNLSRRPFKARAPRRLSGRGPLKVALFVGCGIEALFPRVGEAFLAICAQRGIEVVIPGGQGCCGLLSESAGELELAQALGRRVLEEFAGLKVDYLVAPCASCSFQLKRLGRLFQDAPEGEPAARLALKVREASEFLVQVVGYRPDFRRQLEQVAFHDPCHLHRGQGIVEEPRQLLEAATGVAPVEPAERVCCGLGGAFGVLYPEISLELGATRFEALKAAGAQRLVTSCSGCLIQLSHAAAGFKVSHLLEVLAPIAERE